MEERLVNSQTQVLDKRPWVDGPTIVGILSLVNAALGAGVLAYPFAFMSAGMVLASVFTTAIGVLSMCSLCIIMHCMTILQAREGAANVKSFGDLVKYGLGQKASTALEALIVVYMFGACVGYLEVLDDVFHGVVSDAQLSHVGLDRQQADVLCLCAAAVLCFALATLRSIEALKYTAAAAVLAVFFTVGTLVFQAFAHPCLPDASPSSSSSVSLSSSANANANTSSRCDDENGRHGWTKGEHGVSLWPESAGGILKALPLICFAVQCQIQCAAAYCEMPPSLARSGARRRRVAYGATLLTLILYFPAGIAGFARFGDATQGDILANFGVKDGFADVARFCMALTALSAFPCQHYPARTILHKIWTSRFSPPEPAPVVNVHVGEFTSSGDALRADGGGGGGDDASLNADGSGGGGGGGGGLSLAFALTEALCWTLVVLGTTIWAVLNQIKLDLVFQLIGSVCGSAVILVVPGFLWNELGSGPPHSLCRLIPSAVLILCGLFIMGAGTLVTVNEMVHGTGAAAGNATNATNATDATDGLAGMISRF